MDLILSFLGGVALVYIPVMGVRMLGDEQLMSESSRLMRITISLLATVALVAAFALSLTSWTFLLGVGAAAYAAYRMRDSSQREPEADIIVGDDSDALLGGALGAEAQARLAAELALTREEREAGGEENSPSLAGADSAQSEREARAEALKKLSEGLTRYQTEQHIHKRYPSLNASEITERAWKFLNS